MYPVSYNPLLHNANCPFIPEDSLQHFSDVVHIAAGLFKALRDLSWQTELYKWKLLLTVKRSVILLKFHMLLS